MSHGDTIVTVTHCRQALRDATVTHFIAGEIMSREITPFALRMQPELRAKVEEAAKHNKRSLNAEISARLEITIDIERRLEEARYAGSLEGVPNFIDNLIKHYSLGMVTPTTPSPLSESAIQTLASLYQETLERIEEMKGVNKLGQMSEMDKVELQHEEATAKYLRHAIARAAQR